MMGIKKVFWIDESQTIDEGLKNCLEELGLELFLVKKVAAPIYLILGINICCQS